MLDFNIAFFSKDGYSLTLEMHMFKCWGRGGGKGGGGGAKKM